MSGTSSSDNSNTRPKSRFAERLMGKLTKQSNDEIASPAIGGPAIDGPAAADPTFFKSMAILPDLHRPLNLAKGLPLVQRLKRRAKPPINYTTASFDEAINTPLRETKGKRLSRRELEAMLDQFYETRDQPTPPSNDTPRLKDGQIYHARKAGNRLVVKLAMVSSLALVLGFGVGLYSLSSQGGDTAMGKRLNQAVADIGASISAAMPTGFASIIAPSNPTQKTGKIALARETWTNRTQGVLKPIKTASLVVADASGPIAVGIPLSLTLTAPVSNTFVEVKITNVPRDAVLTAGKRQDNGVWVLKPSDLRGVQLVLSSQSATPLRLNIELVEAKTGELLTPPREIKVSVLATRPFKVGSLAHRFSGGL